MGYPAESWVTIAEADAYFLFKWNASAWATLSNPQKQQLLVSAFRWINQLYTLSISPASTSEIVKNAQCETAWYIYKFWDSHEKRGALYSQGVKKFRVSEFSEDLKGAEFPHFIFEMLEDFIVNVGGKFPVVSRTFENNQ